MTFQVQAGSDQKQITTKKPLKWTKLNSTGSSLVSKVKILLKITLKKEVIDVLKEQKGIFKLKMYPKPMHFAIF